MLKQVNHINPHDASKYNYTYLSNDLFHTLFKTIFLYHIIYVFPLPPTPCHFHPLQVENGNNNSRLVVDEDGLK